MQKIDDNLVKLTARLQQAAADAGRDPKSIALLAVSKTKPAEDLRAAFAAGQRRFGENYLQEALDKQEALADLDIEWHFIGPIQSNKSRPIAENFDWVHSIDRFKIARRISEQRPADSDPINICLQVNIDNEQSKSGVSFAQLPQLARDVASLPRVKLRGLMAIPASREDFEQQRAALETLRNALEQLRETLPRELLQKTQLDTLSMGMSRDLEAAVAAGSTMVRIGTDIFGTRVPKKTAD